MVLAIILAPAIAGALCAIIRNDRLRRWLLAASAIGQCVMVGWCWYEPPGNAAWGWLGLDAAGLLFLSITTCLFLAAAVYAMGYLRQESKASREDVEEGFIFANSPESVFTSCLLLFVAAMSLVAASRHLGLLWAAVEATTLASAPLIYFHRHHRSLEAVWKYLLICSVGIALAMLGNFFLVASAQGGTVRLTIGSLTRNAATLDPVWLKAAFILCLVGYGTKMGLAPMHTWLPDAHSESPSIVSALLSGALLNCAFLGVLRMHSITTAAGLGDFSRSLLVLLGLVSMVLAAVFILHQTDFKRMLAYSSVENMGILALGVGAGGVATFGSMFHAVNHSLVKAMLFLAAGNILAAYGTKTSQKVRRLLGVRPATAVLWVGGLLAVTGFPPFGSFMSELTVLAGVVGAGKYAVAAVYLAALGVTFVAMARIVLPMVYSSGSPGSLGADGKSPAAGLAELAPAGKREPLWSIVPPFALGAAALALGLYMPPQLLKVLREAAALAGAQL